MQDAKLSTDQISTLTEIAERVELMDTMTDEEFRVKFKLSKSNAICNMAKRLRWFINYNSISWGDGQ